MNKKAVARMLNFMIGLFLLVMMIMIVVNIITRAANTFADTEESHLQVKEKLSELKTKNVGSGDNIEIKLSKESAIIGLNSKAEALRLRGISPVITTENEGWPKGLVFYRPVTCEKDKACLCTCNGIAFEELPVTYTEGSDPDKEVVELPNGLITCQSTACLSMDDVDFPSSIPLYTVFEDDKKSYEEALLNKKESLKVPRDVFGGFYSSGLRVSLPLVKNRRSISYTDVDEEAAKILFSEKYYATPTWEGGFIILRSNEIQPLQRVKFNIYLVGAGVPPQVQQAGAVTLIFKLLPKLFTLARYVMTASTITETKKALENGDAVSILDNVAGYTNIALYEKFTGNFVNVGKNKAGKPVLTFSFLGSNDYDYIAKSNGLKLD